MATNNYWFIAIFDYQTTFANKLWLYCYASCATMRNFTDCISAQHTLHNI